MTENCKECGRPLGDLEAPGMVGRDHPHTSYIAAASEPGFGTQRYRVMEILKNRGFATAAAVADELGLSRNQIATRVLELHRGGYATFLTDDEDKVVCLPTGPSTVGRVHRLTHAGRAVLDAHQ